MWIETAIRRPVLVTVLFLVISLFGAVSFTRLPVDLFPEIEPPVMSVITVYPGASASDVEAKVTETMEEALGAVSGVEQLSSVSRDSLSVVTLRFDFGANLDAAVNDVRQRLDFTKRQLPDDVEDPQIFKFDTSAFPIVIFAVSSQTMDVRAERDLIEDLVMEPMRRIDGVGSVQIFNAPDIVVRVDVDRDRLVAQGLVLSQVAQALRASNVTVPAGTIDVGAMEFAVRVPGEVTSLDELRETVLTRSPSGGVVRLGDVANVVEGIDDVTERALVNGHVTVAGGVLKRSGANTVEVAEQVLAQLERVQETLPEGMEINIVNDSSEFIVRMVGNLQSTVALGGVLVLVVTLLFLGRLRPSLIVAASIPASMIIAFLVMFVAGYTINAITLMAMALGIGMVVDNAIVVLENITRFVDEGVDSSEAARRGASEVSGALLASTATTVVIFAPMIFVSGLVGIMFGQLAVVMIVTIGASLFVAVTLTPMLSARWIQPQAGGKKRLFDRAMDAVERLYGRVLAVALRWRGTTVAGGTVIAASTLCLMGLLGTDFIPNQDSGEVRVTLELPVGTNVDRTAALAADLASAFREQSEVRMVFERSGQSSTGFGSVMGSKEGSNVATVTARLVSLDERSRSSEEVARAALARLGPIPEAVNVDVVAGSMMTQLLGMGAKPVKIEVLGSNFDTMQEVAADLARRIDAVPGTVDVAADLLQTRPEIRFEISKELASRAAVPYASAATELRTAMAGTVATRYTGGDTPLDVVVRLRDEDRDDVSDLGQVPVQSVLKSVLRVGDIGDVSEGEVPIEIKRVDKARMVTVGAGVEGRSLGDVAADVDAILADLTVPPGVTVRYAGSVEEQRESFADLFALLALGFFLVYLVMAAQFESWLDPFVIMFSIPFAITGAIGALILTGTTLSVPGFLGLIILLGIVVNNAIVLLDYVKVLEESGVARVDALRQAGERRLRPVLMTTLTTMGGMLPLAVASGAGAEIWAPMGRTAFGGLLVSTVVTLVLVPVMYSVTHGIKDMLFKKVALEAGGEARLRTAQLP
ncbi:MAG: efflux RND transporter permease subunit [Alphaproteobacteria bacterium]|nr:efflux RND transporter permease subunit [Alphaproteobacteria bacterium]